MKRTLSISLEDNRIIIENHGNFTVIEGLGLAAHLMLDFEMTDIHAIQDGRELRAQTERKKASPKKRPKPARKG